MSAKEIWPDEPNMAAQKDIDARWSADAVKDLGDLWTVKPRLTAKCGIARMERHCA